MRAIALALPEVNERHSHGEPCFFVRDRRPLCYYHDDHNCDGRITLWCPSGPGAQAELVALDPHRYFRPTPSAAGAFDHWIGIYLDSPRPTEVGWNEIAEILQDAYSLIAPRNLVRVLDQR